MYIIYFNVETGNNGANISPYHRDCCDDHMF